MQRRPAHGRFVRDLVTRLARLKGSQDLELLGQA
jgi:hypothetical protein